MTRDLHSMFPLWAVGLIMVVLMLAAVECGYRAGRMVHRRSTRETERTAADLSAPAIGLMGLMLAFTFGWAAARVDARQSVRVAEAQAIGRLYRLSVFLPEDDQERLRATLREYITASLAVRDTGSFVRAFRQREVMHHVLWQVVTKAAQEHQNVNSNIVAQLVASVNEVLDAHLSRAIMAVSSRIPTGIVGGLLVILALTMGMIGYQLGVAGSPRSLALIPLVISTATFVLIIADLDRPLEGLLHVHDQALAELQRQLQGWR